MVHCLNTVGLLAKNLVGKISKSFLKQALAMTLWTSDWKFFHTKLFSSGSMYFGESRICFVTEKDFQVEVGYSVLWAK